MNKQCVHSAANTTIDQGMLQVCQSYNLNDSISKQVSYFTVQCHAIPRCCSVHTNRCNAGSPCVSNAQLVFVSFLPPLSALDLLCVPNSSFGWCVTILCVTDVIAGILI